MKNSLIILALVTCGLIVGCRPHQSDDIYEDKYPSEDDSWIYNGDFHALIKDADKIVIRDGHCDSAENIVDDKVLFVITNKQDIVDLYTNLRFETKQGGECECGGYPGMDWYRGTNRLAITSIKHCSAVGWEKFPGDAELNKQSQALIKKWLLDNGLREEDIK